MLCVFDHFRKLSGLQYPLDPYGDILYSSKNHGEASAPPQRLDVRKKQNCTIVYCMYSNYRRTPFFRSSLVRVCGCVWLFLLVQCVVCVFDHFQQIKWAPIAVGYDLTSQHELPCRLRSILTANYCVNLCMHFYLAPENNMISLARLFQDTSAVESGVVWWVSCWGLKERHAKHMYGIIRSRKRETDRSVVLAGDR